VSDNTLQRREHHPSRRRQIHRGCDRAPTPCSRNGYGGGFWSCSAGNSTA